MNVILEFEENSQNQKNFDISSIIGFRSKDKYYAIDFILS